MIGFDEAIAHVRSAAAPLAAETVPTAQADGRVLARRVIARIDSPRSNVSAMDGYAIRDDDLEQFPVSLEVAGESAAGSAWSGSVAPGDCVRIFTGARAPEGADRVVLAHEVRLMPPAYVKPYLKRGKTDANDAEAISEAMTRPTMRFVPVKSPEQQAALALHRTRDLLVSSARNS